MVYHVRHVSEEGTCLFFVKIDIRLVCLLISLMDRFKNIVGFSFTFSLLFLGLPANLQAVDFNNTQVDQEVYEQAISWENLQDRNGVIFAPNAEEPLTGYIRKLYPNTQVEVLVRLSLGLVDQVSRWKPNGIPLYSVEVIPGGLSIQSIPEGSEQLDGSQFNGITRFWYPTGQSMLEVRYSFGKRDGLTRSWYENGNLKVEENYKNGLKDGNARSWFESGEKWMDYTHWNDKRDGPLIWWFENGQKRQEGNYKGGQRFGEWTYYREDGTVLYKKVFRDGKSISTKYGDDDSE